KPFDLKCDFVFNFASPASPPHYQVHSIYTLRTGSEGTRNLLEIAKRHQARFLHASTSEVYGDPAVHPQPETYWGNVNTIGVRSCYDEAKRYAEALIMEYWRKEGVDTRMIRIFNTYGPRLDPNDGRVISNYIKQALKGDPLTVFGDGKQTRSFQYVDDLVIAVQKVMFTPGLAGEVFNTGNPGEFTMIQAAKLVQKITRSRSKIVFRELPKDDPTRRKPDISKIKRRLGWSPKIKFEDGLKRTIAWYMLNEIKV
ncbi:MAG TPA: GDP-mannose 4,6-dehydratase, partial [bacterium]|nr:GDP-mannose 4,6-dehydratase [bacterium]